MTSARNVRNEEKLFSGVEIETRGLTSCPTPPKNDHPSPFSSCSGEMTWVLLQRRPVSVLKRENRHLRL